MSTAPNSTPLGGCVLLVDDNAMDVELTIEAFESTGVFTNVKVASNGEEALNYLLGVGPHSNRTTSPLPDFILLDLKMPKMDGFEVLRQIKATPIIKRIPIIVLTSSRETLDLVGAYDFGTNSYLRKPLSLSSLKYLITYLETYWLTLNESVEPHVTATERE